METYKLGLMSDAFDSSLPRLPQEIRRCRVERGRCHPTGQWHLAIGILFLPQGWAFVVCRLAVALAASSAACICWPHPFSHSVQSCSFCQSRCSRIGQKMEDMRYHPMHAPTAFPCGRSDKAVSGAESFPCENSDFSLGQGPWNRKSQVSQAASPKPRREEWGHEFLLRNSFC